MTAFFSRELAAAIVATGKANFREFFSKMEQMESDLRTAAEAISDSENRIWWNANTMKSWEEWFTGYNKEQYDNLNKHAQEIADFLNEYDYDEVMFFEEEAE